MGQALDLVEQHLAPLGVLLARLLDPRDFGLANMVLVFSSLVLVFSDLALGAGETREQTVILVRGFIVAGLIGAALIVLQLPLSAALFEMSPTRQQFST